MRDAKRTRGKAGVEGPVAGGASDEGGTSEANGAARAQARRLRGLWSRDTWVRPYLGRYRRMLACALVLGALALAFSAALMFSSGYLISAAAERPYSVFELFVPLGLVQLFGVGRPFLHYFERLASHDWVLRMTSDMRLRLYRHVEGDAFGWSALRRTGDVLGLLSEDIAHIQNLYLRTIFPTVIAWAGWVLLVAALGRLSVAYALAMLVAVGVLVVLVPLVSVLVNGARQVRAKHLDDELYAEVTDDVLGATDWALARRAGDCVARVDRQARLAREQRDRVAAFSRRRDAVVTTAFGALAVLVCAWAAGELGGTAPAFDPDVAFNARPADWIAAYVLGFFPLVDAFVPLSDAAVEAGAHADSIERLNALDEGRAAPFGKVEQDGSAGAPAAATGTCATTAPAGAVGTRPTLAIEGVRFAYAADEREVLRGVSLTVHPGEHLALLGASGSGKSTLLSLVRGDLVPTAGRVRLDGVDTCELGPAASRCFGVVQQRTYLFHASLLENLRIADTGADEARAWDALERVRMREVVEALPEGIHTMVDEGGMRFSGGERHRIALARVLLQDAPVVLLDEPFASLDPRTESELVDTLLDALADRTLVLVTHHLLGVSRMDRVAFLEAGELSMCGTPAELAAGSERYRRLLAFDRGEAPGA